MIRWLRSITLCRLGWPLFFHRARVIETYDSCTRKLYCRDCHAHFAMSDRHQAILPWDKEYEQITQMIYGIPRSKVGE